MGEVNDQEVAQRARKKPEAGDNALEIGTGGGVRVFKTGGADEDFGNGEEEVGDALPEDGKRGAGVKQSLDESNGKIGYAGEDDAAAHAAQGRSPAPYAWVDEKSDNRDEDHHKKRIDALHLFRAENKTKVFCMDEDEWLHFFSLEHPAGHRLVEEAPKRDNHEKDDEHTQKIARFLDALCGKTQIGLVRSEEEA